MRAVVLTGHGGLDKLVYEPDWPRLTARASQLLGRGKVVAWFHGALDFGPRSLGGREHPAHGPQAPVERELADRRVAAERLRRDLP